MTTPTKVWLGLLAFKAAGTVKEAMERVIERIDGDVLLMNGSMYIDSPPCWETEEAVRSVVEAHHKRLLIDPRTGIEMELRTRMFSLVTDGEHIFQLDADELIDGSVEALFDLIHENPDIDVFWLKVAEEYFYEKLQHVWKPKIFRVRRRMHFAPNHWTLKDQHQDIVTNWSPVYRPPHYRYLFIPPSVAMIDNLGKKADPEYAKYRKARYDFLDSTVDPRRTPDWEMQLKLKGTRMPEP